MPKVKDKKDRPTPDDSNGEPPRRPPIEDKPDTSTAKPKFQCIHCGKTLAHQGSLRRHLVTVHGVDETGARLQDDQIARLRGVRAPRPTKEKRQGKASRTKPFKSAEFVESEPDVKPMTPRPDETASEPPPSESEPGPPQPREEYVDLTEDLTLSDTSSESPDGASEDER